MKHFFLCVTKTDKKLCESQNLQFLNTRWRHFTTLQQTQQQTLAKVLKKFKKSQLINDGILMDIEIFQMLNKVVKENFYITFGSIFLTHIFINVNFPL